MENLRIIEAAGISVTPLDASTLRWDAVRLSCAVFNENVTRTARMVEVPAYAALTADVHRLAIHRVCGGEPNEGSARLLDANGGKVSKIMAEIINPDNKEAVRMLMECLTRNLDTFIARTTNVHEIFQAFLNSVLIQAWTSLEVLMRQLLRESATRHPECFRRLTAENLNALQTKSYQKLESIREAYSTGFSSHSRVTNPINEQCVDALALLRNILVHNGGRVDETFRKGCVEKHLNKWAEYPVDMTFPTKGDTVKDLVERNVGRGYALVKAVDSWLTSHKAANR